MTLAARLVTTSGTTTTSSRPPWTSPDADPKETRGKGESWALILLLSEAVAPNTILSPSEVILISDQDQKHGGGVGVWSKKVNYLGCCFSPSTPTQGHVREREKTDGSQDPTLQLGGA